MGKKLEHRALAPAKGPVVESSGSLSRDKFLLARKSYCKLPAEVLRRRIGLTKERLQFGREGESAALTFLKKKGYRILEKNFRSKVGEIDIIAEQVGVIVFIEVKARANHEFGHPLNALTPIKQKKIIQTANSFLARKRIFDKPMRFDVVALTSDAGSPDSWQIELLENAFQI